MRKLKPFYYHHVSTIEEALSLLCLYGEEAKIVAGGTDLLLMMKQAEIVPKHLVDVKGIPALDLIEKKNDSFTIGALTRINTLAQSSLIKKHFPLVSQAAETLGSYQVRNRATIGGNICNASPSADMVPGLLCLDASLLLSQRKSDRTIPLEDFFTGPGETVLSKEEMLSRIIVPQPRGELSGTYLKHSVRNALDLAIVGVAVKIERNPRGYSAIRIALGGVAPTPIRAKKTEEFLEKEGLSEKTLLKASEMVGDEITPISDVRGSAEYRIGMTRVLVKRGLDLSMKGFNT